MVSEIYISSAAPTDSDEVKGVCIVGEERYMYPLIYYPRVIGQFTFREKFLPFYSLTDNSPKRVAIVKFSTRRKFTQRAASSSQSRTKEGVVPLSLSLVGF